ncbi:MAG: acyl-CoA dehydratase activase, partial [Chitinispirillaceae bacterium]
MKVIGICFGATTMQCVELSGNGQQIAVDRTVRIPHEGTPRKAFLEYLKLTGNPITIDRIAVTGRAFRNCVSLSSISEPEAMELALHRVYDEKSLPDAVISSGGETQIVYTINRSGGIGAALSGNKCASGTGEFFLQQIRRMGLSPEEAVNLALQGTPHRIAGRCSVFCKSDCTHALNKGESKANIASGLCLMMADKIHELIKDGAFEKIALVGGGSLNVAMISHLKKRYPSIDIPPYASCFEAYGAALWALNNICQPLPEEIGKVIKARPDSFSRHRPLREAVDLVDFKTSRRDYPRNGDECILGLDVGSTTTKAVLMRKHDTMVVASVYLRTNGDPVRASRDCYKELLLQMEGATISISGLGVTGSGRQIAALHALTGNVINEIIAHATAAAWFDPEVDTIFEIGGQDAKYTYLTGGVASDYAMNEACSAGTGSFLEESAKESLNVPTEEIAEQALRGGNPPNFTDQCAAFISSDIKTAAQEGIGREDILAGLVYSICLNYCNRVKGSRPIGKKIFMQGGVCYNRAIPLAMASLMNTRIIVPPEPGLMGAFGVALEVANRIDRGLARPDRFTLEELIERDAKREGSFVCNGGRDQCDRKCEILRIRVDGELYPFGGVCNKYYNLRLHREVNTAEFDLVALRQRLMFEEYGIPPVTALLSASSGGQDRPAKTVGIMRSLLTHSLYPLYSNFFNRIGFSIVFSDEIDRAGIARIEAAFCLPAEITHGSFYNLLLKKPDYIFMPQVSQLPVPKVPTWSRTCVFVQGEPYYLRTTFRSEIEQSATVLLSPVLRMDGSYEAAEDAVAAMARSMGITEIVARGAWRFACEKQRAFERELLNQGEKVMAWLDANPDKFGIVLFGRPYSAFSTDANKGIPHKTASRGYPVIPFDMLPAADITVDEKMFWAMGQKIMKAADVVKNRGNLFGFYITNFSCGPDSFLLGYFRRCMGTKPSLTLEVDQHTADAGIDTRVEAAIDIMEGFRRIGDDVPKSGKPFEPAKVVYGKEISVTSSDGRRYALTDPVIEIVLPNMGRYSTEATAAVLRGRGFRAKALPIAGKDDLLEGRKNATCKECLPYLVTTGSFISYLQQRKENDTVTLLFIPTGGGPCRLGQYCKALSHVIEKNRIGNAAVFAMTDENGYAGLGARALLKAWQALVAADIVCDIRSLLSVAAENKNAALAALEYEWEVLLTYFEGRLSTQFSTLLSAMAKRLSSIRLRKMPGEIPVISLVGEIFVRRDEFSRKTIVDYLENRGFMVRVAPVTEYMCYSNYVVNNGLGERVFTGKEQVRMHLTARIQEWWEWRIRSILARSGLCAFEMIEVEKTIECASHLVNVNFRGEAILTIGLALREILQNSCGVISIGPFGCMPSRVAEAILNKEMCVEGKKRLAGWEKRAGQFADIGDLPFLSIETDGMPFPQIIEANLETFILQARRLHDKLVSVKASHGRRQFFRYLPIVRLYEIVARNTRQIL